MRLSPQDQKRLESGEISSPSEAFVPSSGRAEAAQGSSRAVSTNPKKGKTEPTAEPRQADACKPEREDPRDAWLRGNVPPHW